MRGGGGNFGVVTSFEVRLHALGPEVLAGLVVYSLAQAKQVFEGYRRFTAGASDDMTVWMVLRKEPPTAVFPASRGAWQGGGYPGLLLDWGHRAGSGADPAAAQLWPTVRRNDCADALRMRALFDAIAPYATGGVYVNFMPEDEAQRVAVGRGYVLHTHPCAMRPLTLQPARLPNPPLLSNSQA